MSDRNGELAKLYLSSLQEFLAGGGEACLERVYELGREAVEQGLGVLDVDALRGQALDELLQRAQSPAQLADLVRKALEWGRESLAPFEMTHRSYRESNERLRQLNRMLQAEITERKRTEDILRTTQEQLELRVRERTAELAAANNALEDQIAEQRRISGALRESEERFRQLTSLTGEWIWEQDADGRYIYSSPGVASILGFAPEEVIGKYYYDLFLPDEDTHNKVVAAAELGGKRSFFRLVNRYRHKDGSEVFTESSGIPVFDARERVMKWRGIDHDITERKRFEDALRLRDRAIEASSVGIIITDARQPGGPIIYANPAFARMTGYSLEELYGSNPRMLQGPETDPGAIEEVRRALRETRSCLVTLKNYRKDGSTFWNELFISPVRDDAGVLTHYVGIQTDVTELRRAEEERHEMEIAKQIQLSLLPREPLHIDGALIAGYCLPAAHVGGDYFDYFCSHDSVDIVIADVSGHSVGAALVMAETRSTLKAEAQRLQCTPLGEPRSTGEILHTLNGLLFEDLNRSELFITMFYIKYDTATGQLNYANAGHNRPLLLRSDASSCAELDAEGLILGVVREVQFEEKSVHLHKGDMVLLYTDGIVEAQNGVGEFFGEARLRDLLVAQRHGTPQQIITEISNALARFCGRQSFTDDVSMVVLKMV